MKKLTFFSDWENAEETLARAKVIVANGSIVLLAGRIKNVDLCLLPVEYYFFAVWIGLKAGFN